jgi:hypothetical protein
MGKIAYQQPIEHTSDATFQAWITNLHNAIIAAGLVDPGDTGQLDLSTATRPGTNTWAGYRIYRFNDTNQGAYPVFIRLEFGTGSTAAGPQMRFTIGQGSDGAGTITGANVVSNTLIAPGNQAGSSTSRRTRVMCKDGLFWFAHGLGFTGDGTNCHGFLKISRSVSSDGTPNADGIAVYYRSGTQYNNATTTSLACFMLRAAAGGYTCERGSWCMVWGGVTTSVTGGLTQTYLHALPWPRVRLMPSILTVFHTEYGDDVEFDAITVGATSRRFISLGPSFAGSATVNNNWYCAFPNNANYTLALEWE